MSAVFEYWASGAGLSAMTPPNNEWPEGEPFKRWLVDEFFGQDVVEFGCGTGRLAQFFSKRRYVGLDICARAIDIARADNRGYDFFLLDPGQPITASERTEHVAFAHSTLLHIPDGNLQAVVDRFRQKRVIVSEILGIEWYNGLAGVAPIFGREIEGYERPFRKAGYRLHRVQFKPMENYRPLGRRVDRTILEFHKETTNADQP